MAISNTSRRTAEFSSSEPMVERIRSDNVLTLGKKLVDELGLDQSVDTLGRWMAHYIAEKMEAVESATGEARDRKMSECSDAILKLWAHRSELPNDQRPFKEFERIFRMLQSLDLDAPTPRHFRQARSAAAQDDKDDATKQWLNIASGIDDAARVLIRYCLATAAQEAVDKSREWIALAEAIAEEEDIDLRTVRAIVEDAEVLNSENLDDAARAKIEDLLEKLEAFTAFSSTLSSCLRGQLGQAAS